MHLFVIDRQGCNRISRDWIGKDCCFCIAYITSIIGESSKIFCTCTDTYKGIGFPDFRTI